MISTKPYHPWKNTCEKRVGNLGSMVRQIMREFGAPMRKYDWEMKWCSDVHNVLANRSKEWIPPMEIRTGQTPDISKFRFNFWEPIWYFEP